MSSCWTFAQCTSDILLGDCVIIRTLFFFHVGLSIAIGRLYYVNWTVAVDESTGLEV